MNVEPTTLEDPELEEELDVLFHGGNKGDTSTVNISTVPTSVSPGGAEGGASSSTADGTGSPAVPDRSVAPVDDKSSPAGHGNSVSCKAVPCTATDCKPVACQPSPCRPRPCRPVPSVPAPAELPCTPVACPPPVSCVPPVSSSVAVAALAGGLVTLVAVLAVVGFIVVLRYTWPLLVLIFVFFIVIYLHRRRPGGMRRLHVWAESIVHRVLHHLPGWPVPIPEVRFFFDYFCGYFG